MNYTQGEWMRDKLMAILDKYHTTATLPLNDLIDKIFNVLAILDMYEALKQNIVDYKVLCQRKPKNTLLQTRLAMAQKALAKAEGKEK